MTIRYEWNPAWPIKPHNIDVQAAGEALAVIENANGSVTPEAVVSAAKSKRHVLHGYFNWNDADAADKYRCEQARKLIQAVRVVVEEQGAPVLRRAFVHVDNGQESTRYLTTSLAMQSESLRDQILEKARGDLNAWIERYEELNELAGLVAEVKVALRRAYGLPIAV